MKCPYCGNQVSDGLLFCDNCGGTINTNVQNGSIPNTHLNYSNTDANNNVMYISEQIEKKLLDKVSVGICLLSFLIPLVGIIYFFVNRKTYPRKCKGALICAIIGFILPYIFMFISYLFSMLLQ